jgi:flagellar hook-associated protein 2
MSSVSSLASLLSSSSSAAVDLSAILEAATGASTPGIDVTSAVNAAVTAAEAPENNWESQQTTLQNQTTALTSLQTDATNLDSDVQALNSLTGPLSAATVNSSSPSVVTGSAAAGAAAGNNIVVVNSLATTASWSSTSVASETTALPSESIVIIAASGATATFTTGSGVNTLSQLSTAINSAGIGVTASIIQDATGYRVAVTSNTSGSAGSFTISAPSSGLEFTQGSAGANASLTVNGIAFSSATNTVTGAIPGLTLNLQSASPGTEVSVDVAPDTSQASSAINQFVSDYNTLISALNSQFAYTSGSGQGVLADDPTVRNLQSELLGALDYTATPASGSSSTTMPNLSSMGITVNDDGTLSVNNTTLDTALQNNFSDVQNFFQGSALNGFANSLDQQLTSFVSPADGAFTVDLQSMNSENTTLQDDINNFQANVIAPLKTQLQSEFSQAEIALQELPSEIRNVDAELGINTNSSSGG